MPIISLIIFFYFCLPVESISMVLKRMLCGISARESCGRSQLSRVTSVSVAFGVHSISVWMTLPKLGSGTLKARAATIPRNRKDLYSIEYR